MNLVNRRLFIIFLLIFHVYSCTTEKKAIDFSLNNWDGKIVTLTSLKDRVIVLTFSYTYCTVKCPIITARLSSLDQMMKAPRDVVYLHISVDPKMDTPERRKGYFKRYEIDQDKRWMFLSGQKDELLKLWNFYNIDIKKIIDKRIEEGYYMQYTPKVLIIDKKGSIKYMTNFNFLENKLSKKIKGQGV